MRYPAPCASESTYSTLQRTSRISRRLGGLVAAAVLAAAVLAAGGAAWAADLDANQVKTLERVRSELDRLEVNLKSAQDTAGPGDKQPTGSRAKLAMARLNTAKGSLPNVEALLAKLPADHPDVQAAQQQYDADVAAINQLEARITGQAAGGSGGGAAGGAAAGVKLDYQQEEKLKNARFHLREVEGKAAALADLVAQIQAAGDVRSFDHREVQAGMNTLADADRKVGHARAQLEGLPADGAGVKDVTDALAQVVAKLAAARQALTPVHEQLAGLINPASYPTLPADTERLRELARMYANPLILQENRGQAAELVGQMTAATAERERLTKAYAVLIVQDTPEGQQIAGASNGFANNVESFSAAVEQQKQSLPGEIRSDLAQAQKLAEQAAAEKKPAFFNGGIPQQMAFAEEKLKLFAAIDPAGAKPLAGELAATRASLQKAQDALREDIINANELPPDRYTGADRDAVIARAKDALSVHMPNAKVLAARIPGENWRRETMWRLSGDTWSKSDRSKLQVQLIVERDGKLAEIRPVNMWRDHLANDEVIGTPLFAADEELAPQSLMLRAKVK